jgi:hypothetical protein
VTQKKLKSPSLRGEIFSWICHINLLSDKMLQQKGLYVKPKFEGRIYDWGVSPAIFTCIRVKNKSAQICGFFNTHHELLQELIHLSEINFFLIFETQNTRLLHKRSKLCK